MNTSAPAPVPEIRKGLEGVLVDESKVSKVMPDINALVYYGYPVQDLADNCTFEEVAYLLWHGELPNKQQLQEFCAEERSMRKLSPELQNCIKLFPRKGHPMDATRTGISFLGLEDPLTADNSPQANLRKSMNMLAKAPAIVASFYRLRKGQEPIAPKKELSFSENFFHMCFGEVPAPEVVKAFDASLVLYAEHGFNASTFTGRVVASTLSDIYSSVTAAVGALKGPLHGGANEAVMHMLLEIGSPDKAKEWMLDAIKNKKKIMGFGHRVYKKGDSRAPTMNKYGLSMAKVKGEMKWHEISAILEETMVKEKNIHPNLDFPAGPAYYLMGFDIDMFTPFFVMSRITGWTAHIIEQLGSNRLIRPLCKYIGPSERKVVPLAQRNS